MPKSNDGYYFIEHSIVSDHDDNSVWNSGDKLYPLGVYYNNIMLYLNYTSDDWELDLAWGPNPDNLPNNYVVIDSSSDVIFDGDVVWIIPATWLEVAHMFVNYLFWKSKRTN